MRYAWAPKRSTAIRGARAVAGLALGAALLVSTGCTPGSGTPVPSASPVASSPGPPARTVTAANLIDPTTLPEAIGGGKIEVYEQNARPVDALSICQPQPLSTLGATASVTRDFRTVWAPGDEPFGKSALDGQPDTYTVALQFTDAAAAVRAKSLWEGWVIACREGVQVSGDYAVKELGSGWTRVPAAPAKGEVAEVVYQPRGAKGHTYYWESTGLTVLEDRLMVTITTYYTDESLFVVNSDDEDGSPHPQLALVAAAGKALAR